MDIVLEVWARLVLINEDGSDGSEYLFYVGINFIGCSGVVMEYGDDVYLSFYYVDLVVEGDFIMVMDRVLLNGIFICIMESALIEYEDMFWLGQEFLWYEELIRIELVMLEE